MGQELTAHLIFELSKRCSLFWARLPNITSLGLDNLHVYAWLGNSLYQLTCHNVHIYTVSHLCESTFSNHKFQPMIYCTHLKRKIFPLCVVCVCVCWDDPSVHMYNHSDYMKRDVHQCVFVSVLWDSIFLHKHNRSVGKEMVYRLYEYSDVFSSCIYE